MATSGKRKIAELSPEELKRHRKTIYDRYHGSEKHIRTRRKSQYMKRYGITIEQYEYMLSQQRGVCKICGNKEATIDPKGNVRALAVDHCHTTKKVRGLLCSNCNTILGQAKDNVTVLENAIKYLRES